MGIELLQQLTRCISGKRHDRDVLISFLETNVSASVVKRAEELLPAKRLWEMLPFLYLYRTWYPIVRNTRKGLLLQRALKILEQAVGPDHPKVAASLYNLALLYRTQGQYTEALPLFERALSIDEQVYGPSHPEVATDLERLAILLWAMQ